MQDVLFGLPEALRHSYFDTHGETRVAFRNLSTPESYVLDERGRVRFTNHSPTLSLVEAVGLAEPV